MRTMMKWRYATAAGVVLAGTALFLYGCECGVKAPPAPKEALVARINGYELTVSDFKDEADLTFANKALPEGPGAAKRQLLEEIITKKVLLQEAQRRDFDKKRPFMKEIERYWEQALLKLLVQEKTRELARQVTVTDDEVRREYALLVEAEGATGAGTFEEAAPGLREEIRRRKIRDALDAWIAGARQKANVKVYDENLDRVAIGPNAR